MSTEGAAAGELGLYCLRVEGQNFDWIIYDTHDLSTIAGGSQLLERAPDRVKELLSANKIAYVKAWTQIQSAASIGMFALRAEQKDIGRILQQIKEDLRNSDLGYLTIQVDAIQISCAVSLPSANGSYNISHEELKKIETAWLRKLEASGRFAQMRALNFALPQIVRGVHRACCEDHVRPATGDGDRSTSSSVEARRKEGKAFRWRSDRPRHFPDAVQTFDEMTEWKGNPRWNGRMAVISIDGKGFGRLWTELCQNADDVREFSEQLLRAQDAFHGDLISASERTPEKYYVNYSPNREEMARGRAAGRLFRLQRLVAAGDDSVYLMPAWLAWEFLERFFDRRWVLMGELAQRAWALDAKKNGEHAEGERPVPNPNPFPLSFRAGVVICHAKAPIHPIRELAHRLESEVAKRDGKEIANPVAYEVLKSFDFIGPGLTEYRERKRAGLAASQVLLNGGKLKDLYDVLHDLNKTEPSSHIKNPRFRRETNGNLRNDAADRYHLSQWRDYLFED
jgi:hypothetical protein